MKSRRRNRNSKKGGFFKYLFGNRKAPQCDMNITSVQDLKQKANTCCQGQNRNSPYCQQLMSKRINPQCNETNIEMSSLQDLHNSYQTCCPPTKGMFGSVKKNKSPYCQKLDNVFRQKQIEENDSHEYIGYSEEDQVRMRNEYQPLSQPPPRKRFGFFGGRKTRRRKSRKSKK